MYQNLEVSALGSLSAFLAGAGSDHYNRLLRAQSGWKEEAHTKGRGNASWDRKEIIDIETKEAVELIRGGATAKEVGEMFGVSGNAIQLRLKSRGLTVSSIKKEANV